LFAKEFLNPVHRRETLEAIASWHPLGHAQAQIAFFKPLGARLARFLDRHYVLFNFVSNPLIDLGILFELLLSYLFFYSPLSRIYYFAPVPWHVYLFAFHATFLLLAFEEIKKYYRRKGHSLEFLG
jgi:sodium/potassium-transporting ATPase subunit alpha